MSIHDKNLVVRRLFLMYNAYVSVPFRLFNHLLGYFTHNQGFFLSFLGPLGIKKLFITRKVFARFMVYQNLKITCCPAFGSRFSQLFFLPWVCPKNLRGTSVSTSQWELPPPLRLYAGFKVLRFFNLILKLWVLDFWILRSILLV